MRLKDRVILVTGGAAGIGKATALRFAEEGAKVVICDVNEEAGQAVLKTLGPEASFYKVNVADRQAVQQWINDVAAKYGRIDVLVNNAGVLRDGTLVKVKDGELVKQMPEADFDLVISINLKGVFNCTQAVAPIMIKQGGGVILNATSIVGLDGNFGQTNYGAAKAGIIGFTKSLARELGSRNVRANVVAPGYVKTRLTDVIPEEGKALMLANTPLGRLGDPEDVAGALVALCDPAAGWLTGNVINVVGGGVAAG